MSIVRRVGAAAALLVLAAGAGVAAGDDGRSVFYQVTYTNGAVREVPAVPTGRQGIARVVRVTRIEQGQKGYEILSTGPEVLTLVNRGQTYRTDLTWNGKAWVAPEAPGPPAVVIQQAVGGERPPSRDAPRRAAELAALAGRLLECEAALAEAQEALSATAGARDANKPAAGQAAAAAGAARREIRAAVAEIARQLAAVPAPQAAVGEGPGDRRAASQAVPGEAVPGQAAPGEAVPGQAAPGRGAGEPPGEPSGQVTPAPADPQQAPVGGIARPIAEVAALPIRTEVWRLPASEGRRTIRVSMAHAEAGPAGAFHYVAYADTDGDGRPDRLLARSPLAVAETAGQWTQWQFATDQKDVFVGSAWAGGQTVRYHTHRVRIADDWRLLSPRAYVSVDAWGLPLWRWGPAFGNVRVWVEQ